MHPWNLHAKAGALRPHNWLDLMLKSSAVSKSCPQLRISVGREGDRFSDRTHTGVKGATDGRGGRRHRVAARASGPHCSSAQIRATASPLSSTRAMRCALTSHRRSSGADASGGTASARPRACHTCVRRSYHGLTSARHRRRLGAAERTARASPGSLRDAMARRTPRACSCLSRRCSARWCASHTTPRGPTCSARLTGGVCARTPGAARCVGSARVAVGRAPPPPRFQPCARRSDRFQHRDGRGHGRPRVGGLR